MAWSAGSTVLTLKPLVVAVTPQRRLQRCDACLSDEEDKLLRCAACKIFCYCSKACQTKEWSWHKLECKFLRTTTTGKDKQIPSETALSCSTRLLLKLAVLVTKPHVESLQDVSDSAFLQSLEDLPHHSKAMKSRESFCKEFADINDYLRLLWKDQAAPSISDELLWTLFCKIWIHAIPLVCVSSTVSVGGRGLFPSISAVKQSCRPNCEHFFYNGRLVLKALEAIPSISCTDFSNVTLMFDFALRPQELRKRNYERLFLKCHCARCQDEAKFPFLIRCSAANCTGICKFNSQTFKCLMCETCGAPPHPRASNNQVVVEYHMKLFCLLEDEDSWQDSCTADQLYYSDLNPLHPLDMVSLNVHILMMERTVQKSREDYLKFLISAYELHAPWKSIWLGILYKDLAEETEKTDVAMQLYNKALCHLKLVLDCESSLVLDLEEIVNQSTDSK